MLLKGPFPIFWLFSQPLSLVSQVTSLCIIKKDKTKSRPKTAFLPVALFKTLIRIPRLQYHPIYLEVVDRVRDTFNIALEMLTHLLSLWQEYTTLCFRKLVFFSYLRKIIFRFETSSFPVHNGSSFHHHCESVHCHH